MEIPMSAQVRYVCPLNGTPADCEVCEDKRRHRCETLAPEGKPPLCPTHAVRMVRGRD
jgi:hypothetical protein